MPFSNAFSWTKIVVDGFKFHWSLFVKVQLAIHQCHFWFRWWLGAVEGTSHYLNQWGHRLLTHIRKLCCHWLRGLWQLNVTSICCPWWHHMSMMLANTGSGNGLVPDGAKPLSEPVLTYRQNIRRTLVGNKIVDHSDVVGASPVGAAPTTSSFST